MRASWTGTKSGIELPNSTEDSNRIGPVIIPYLPAGAGHLSAAQAVAESLEERGCFPELLDVTELGGQGTERFYVSAWNWILRHRLFGQLAFTIDAAIPVLGRIANRRAAGQAVLAAQHVLDTRRPAAVLATHWGAAHVFAGARRRSRHQPLLFYLFTELGGVYSLIACGADFYFAMGKTAVASLCAAGVSNTLIQQVAPVTHERFRNVLQREEARRRLSLSPVAPVVLYGLGGAGIGEAQAFIAACRRAVPEAVILVATGHNTALRQRLATRFTESQVVPLSFRDDMEVLLAAADLAAGKCGTLFTLEVIASRRPFVITQIGAPNERYNRDFIVRNGYGWYAASPRAFATTVRRALVGREIDAVQRTLEDVPDHGGAEEVAARVAVAARQMISKSLSVI